MMTRTTPPRPVDIAAIFPELREYARTATRMHPRPGAATVHDSAVGGSLLWPANEPWPVCEEPHHDAEDLILLEVERVQRRVLAAAAARTPANRRIELTAEERALVKDKPFRLPAGHDPLPLLAVAQLYARDIPDFRGPERTDVLQLLWCPFDHEKDDLPATLLRWRRAAEVTAVLADQPEPPAMEWNYLPEPCMLHPEQVTEYQYGGLLPGELQQRIKAWEQQAGHKYQYELSIADGWKMGGWASWHLTDPQPMVCDCGRDLELLLKVDSFEWAGGNSWRPIEDADLDTRLHRYSLPPEPTKVIIGRGHALWIFICPESYDHPHQVSMQ